MEVAFDVAQDAVKTVYADDFDESEPLVAEPMTLGGEELTLGGETLTLGV